MLRELQYSLNQYGLSTCTQKCIFPKREGLYFHRAHLHTLSLICESTVRNEKAPFLWIKPQLSANSANTLTSFCKHFHVIQSLTSFVSTRVKLLGKITLFPLKNRFLFKWFPRCSTPPTSSWSWLVPLAGSESRNGELLGANGRWEPADAHVAWGAQPWKCLQSGQQSSWSCTPQRTSSWVLQPRVSVWCLYRIAWKGFS